MTSATKQTILQALYRYQNLAIQFPECAQFFQTKNARQELIENINNAIVEVNAITCVDETMPAMPQGKYTCKQYGNQFTPLGRWDSKEYCSSCIVPIMQR